MGATPREQTGRSSQFVDTSAILFSFAGTISTDQNANIPQIVLPNAVRVNRWRVNVVTPGAGGDVVVKFYVNGGEAASVTLPAGATFAETTAPTDIPAEVPIACEIDSMTTLTPPATMTMMAV